MIDKRSYFTYFVVLNFFASSMMVLIVLLVCEYRFFYNQARELGVLKQQYYVYVDLLQKKINGDESFYENVQAGDNVVPTDDNAESSVHDNGLEGVIEQSSVIMDELAAAEASDAPDDDDEYIDDSFIMINRHPDYLKQSTLDYLQTQDLNSIMTAIDMGRWSDYTEHVHSVEPPKSQRLVKPVIKVVTKETSITPARRLHKDCGLVWPIDGDKFWLSSLFGARKRINGTWGFHHGIDMAALRGTVVKAARAGSVTEASFQTGYGNTVVIKHTDTMSTRYAHLHAIRVHAGQIVKQGGIVGTVGETGFIRKKGKDGSHLHFEVYECGKRINPLHCLPRTV